MADKEFKTIDQQIAILEKRKLTIADREKAKRFLLLNNYYRVSGYSLTLRDHDVFYPNATFQNIIDIYSFDHDLRHLLLHHLESIEVAIKSIYAYEFTKAHGAIGYLDVSNFADPQRHASIIAKGNEQRDRRHPHEAYIKHFMDDLHQDLPLWAYVDLLTIADISFLYAISEQEIKKAVAAHFGLVTNTGWSVLESFMKSMTILRNLCAHGSRLFNRLFEQKPFLNKQEKQLLVKAKDGTVDNAHLYGFILIMRRLLTKEDFQEFKDGLVAITKRYPFVSMRYYGFREDWEEKLV